jgi:hypothetical protein
MWHACKFIYYVRAPRSHCDEKFSGQRENPLCGEMEARFMFIFNINIHKGMHTLDIEMRAGAGGGNVSH